MLVSAMSFGSLGQNAIRAIARGAARAGIPMNTGEGGYPKYHLMEGADVIFQIGTAKFGVRNSAGDLDEAALCELASHEQIRMIESSCAGNNPCHCAACSLVQTTKVARMPPDSAGPLMNQGDRLQLISLKWTIKNADQKN